MSDYVVSSHEQRLKAVVDARRGVAAAYAPRIADLEAQLIAARARPPPAPPALAAQEDVALDVLIEPRTASTANELFCLEYETLPMNFVSKAAPLDARVVSVKRIIGAGAPGEICHVVLHTAGKLPYVEGQSLGVLPPGTDPRTGRDYQQRLYSIASTRYGDDMTGTSVSLCVRRALFVDAATGAEVAEKAGVCSKFLCDSAPGAVVQLTGPTGKGMLLPAACDAEVIMVATGTGIAPFRSFVRRLFVERNPSAASFNGKAWLFLGVPTTSSLLYKDLWDDVESRRPESFRVTYAISREENNADGSRVYVQDKISQNADELFGKMQQGAHIYFCGLKGMMPGIEAAFAASAAARGIDWPTWLKELKKLKQW
ncbi:hypothetical protein M885DRAFT_445501 [Pelagophyceae sp. CCMP2097]|nr:hypothetical protein M885DRAFT_445501 [Pelagophyceae sp. CCMP2097]